MHGLNDGGRANYLGEVTFSSSVLAPFSAAAGFSSGPPAGAAGSSLFFSAELGFSGFSSNEDFFSFLVNCKVSTSSSDRILMGLGAFLRSISELGLIREKFACGLREKINERLLLLALL